MRDTGLLTSNTIIVYEETLATNFENYYCVMRDTGLLTSKLLLCMRDTGH